MSEPGANPVPPAEVRVLLALLDGAQHGHGIKLDIRNRTDGRVDMGPGTLYGAIKRLVRRGWLVEVPAPLDEDDDRKRYYDLTPAGRGAVGDESARLEELLAIARAKSPRPAEGR